MIRLLIFTIIRFIIAALAIYLVLTFIKAIIRMLQGQSHLSQHHHYQANASTPKEEYKDVKDAEFVELPDEQREKKPEHDE
jgi:large-conductance mechanosensitive channel